MTSAQVSSLLIRALGTQAPPAEDKPRVTTLLHGIARAAGWKIEPIRWDTYPMSFHWTAADGPDGRFAILVGGHSPIIAFSSVLPDYFNLRFIDVPKFSEAASTIGAEFETLPSNELKADLTSQDREFVSQLGAQFERDLKYWKPQTVGDVIFNWWD